MYVQVLFVNDLQASRFSADGAYLIVIRSLLVEFWVGGGILGGGSIKPYDY